MNTTATFTPSAEAAATFWLRARCTSISGRVNATHLPDGHAFIALLAASVAVSAVGHPERTDGVSALAIVEPLEARLGAHTIWWLAIAGLDACLVADNFEYAVGQARRSVPVDYAIVEVPDSRVGAELASELDLRDTRKLGTLRAHRWIEGRHRDVDLYAIGATPSKDWLS
jgi:hypothetical protein